MKTIELTKGQVAIVDDEDFDAINRFAWHSSYRPDSKSYYAARSLPRGENPRRMYMHRQILNAKPGEEVDHINRNPLDNRRDNLRIVASAPNKWNRAILSKHNTSGYAGVTWDRNRQKWAAYISHENKKVGLGRFQNKHDAARAYNRACIRYRGPFAVLNKIDDEYSLAT